MVDCPAARPRPRPGAWPGACAWPATRSHPPGRCWRPSPPRSPLHRGDSARRRGEGPSVGRATVFRTLELLVTAGLLDRLCSLGTPRQLRGAGPRAPGGGGGGASTRRAVRPAGGCCTWSARCSRAQEITDAGLTPPCGRGRRHPGRPKGPWWRSWGRCPACPPPCRERLPAAGRPGSAGAGRASGDSPTTSTPTGGCWARWTRCRRSWATPPDWGAGGPASTWTCGSRARATNRGWARRSTSTPRAGCPTPCAGASGWWSSAGPLADPGGLRRLRGPGVWTLRQDGPWTDVRYEWDVRADKPLLRALSFLLGPHRLATTAGRWPRGEGLRLELAPAGPDAGGAGSPAQPPGRPALAT